MTEITLYASGTTELSVARTVNRKGGVQPETLPFGYGSRWFGELIFSYGFLGQFAEDRQGVDFVVRRFDHHENRHAHKHGLDDRMEMKARDALENRAQHLIVEEPCDEKV